MSSFQKRLDDAAGATTCQILRAGGSALVGAGAWSLGTGGPGVGALAVGSLALLTHNYACTWDPDGPSTLPQGSGIDAGQCMKAANGCNLRLLRGGTGGGSALYVTCRELISSVASGKYPNDEPKCTTTFVNCDGEIESDDEAIANLWPITTRVEDGDVCEGQPSPVPPPIYPPYPYQEPDGPDGEPGCSLTVNVLGWGNLPDGRTAPIYKIEPGPETRNSGGVIGGCNFEPVVYYQPNPQPPGGGGDGEPPVVIPFEPGGPEGDPEWLKLLKAALATAAGNLIADGIKEVLEQPVDGVTYEMPAPCDVDADGNQLVWEGQIPEQKFNSAVLDRLDAISNQISQHLTWKTPICSPEPIPLEGDFRTISFRSDETSPYGKSRLRKRLRYRSVSGIDLGDLVDHWKDFTFEAGAVVVGHVGGPWGSPQVWAASEDEAKRVLRHAAGEAGIDPDQVGEWRVGSSNSARYGVSGTMRVDTTGGYFWITARDGASERPIVAKTPHL